MTERISPWRLLVVAAGFAALALAAGACSSPEGPSQQQPAPTLTCPADVTAVSNDGKPVVVTYATPNAVGGSQPVKVGCAPPSGSTFEPGSRTVTCTATDASARTATCGFSVKVSVPPRLALTRFMAFGDSMTAGKSGGVYAFGVENFPGSYPDQLYTALVARYTAQAFVMSRQGSSGETTAAGVTRLQATLPAEQPQVLLLMEGANDLSRGNPASVAPAADNMIRMVTIGRSTGAKVYLATLPPVRPGLKTSGGYAITPIFNANLSSRGPTAGAIMVDIYAALNTDPATYISGVDGLHPTPAGYQKMAETFFTAIRATPGMEVAGVTPSGLAFAPLGMPPTSMSSLSTRQSGPGPTSAAPPSPRRRGR